MRGFRLVFGAAKVAIGPSDKPLTNCTPESGDGVSIAHGGDSTDYNLYLSPPARPALRSEIEFAHTHQQLV